MTEFVIPNHIFDPASECMPVSDRRNLQLTRLRRAVEQARKLEFYRRKKVSGEQIHSLDDIRRLPFTTREDLRKYYPFGFCSVPRADLVRIHVLRGEGENNGIFIGYTKGDMKLWTGLCARFLSACGLTSDQLVQISFEAKLFPGIFGIHGGVERIGAAISASGSGDASGRLGFLHDAEIDTFIGTPGDAMQLGEAIAHAGFRRRDFALRYAQLCGEKWTEEMRSAIEEKLGILAFGSYGHDEIIGPGIGGECAARNGMHIQEDHFLIECVSQETLEPVPDGEEGELVVTALTKEACPLIRYRTGDICRILPGGCPCGRTTRRISWVRSAL